MPFTNRRQRNGLLPQQRYRVLIIVRVSSVANPLDVGVVYIGRWGNARHTLWYQGCPEESRERACRLATTVAFLLWNLCPDPQPLKRGNTSLVSQLSSKY